MPLSEPGQARGAVQPIDVHRLLLLPLLVEGRDGGSHDAGSVSALAPTPALPQREREQESPALKGKKIMKFDPSIVQTSFQSPLGPMTLAATHAGLAGVWFDGQRHLPDQLSAPSSWPADSGHSVLLQTIEQLKSYFRGQRQVFDLKLDLSGGTAFQQAVWRALLTIQTGQTTSYGSISKTINNPAAVRAVGAAVGRNPISIIVPCHRVLGADGSLTGYAGGLERKTALLKLEQALPQQESWTLL